VLIPLLGLTAVGRPWAFLLGFVFGLSAGAGVALTIAGMLQRRSE
jgi:hypothetical protein